MIFHISWLHRISFTYNPTTSFFGHRIVEWTWIEFRMRPMSFKKSWNLFYSNAVERAVKLACFLLEKLELPIPFLFLSSIIYNDHIKVNEKVEKCSSVLLLGLLHCSIHKKYINNLWLIFPYWVPILVVWREGCTYSMA